ncbi:MAG TPA: hypothetical protein VKR06_42495, partial [Ktedonosporobacter sp.]|nr:hypothetical protein [Ktedonosporobacter sp.]
IAGTAQAHASATAHAAATVQIQATATATVAGTLQASYDQITHSLPILKDPLTAAGTNNWDTTTGCSFTNGAYHVISTQKGLITPCFAQASNFSDFAYQVQMSVSKGDYGGIVFRADAKNTKLYLFRVGQDGSYNLYYYPDGTGTNTKVLAAGSSTLILQGLNMTNQIAVIARGATINLYINGKYLTSVSDPTLKAGEIGVIADDTSNPTEVVYSQAQVWNLQ